MLSTSFFDGDPANTPSVRAMTNIVSSEAGNANDGVECSVSFRDALDAIRAENLKMEDGELYWGTADAEDSAVGAALRSACARNM